MLNRITLSMILVICMAGTSCKKNDNDSTPSNVNLTGDYEGTASLNYGGADSTFDVVVSAINISGVTYALSTIDGEFAEVKVSGNNFTGSGDDVVDLSGNLKGNILSFSGNTTDGGELVFTGTRISGSNGNLGSINIDGVSGSRESASCRYGSSDTYNYTLSNGESASIVFDFYDDSKKDAGNYTIQEEVGETDVMAAQVELTLYDTQDNAYARYSSRSGSFTISYEGSNMKHTFNSISFDWDIDSVEELTTPVTVSGFGVWTEDDD